MIQTLALALLGAAFAGDPAAPAPAPATTPAPVDCATLTGDAKVTCEKEAQLKAAQDELLKLGDCAKLAADAQPACTTKKAELEAKIALLTPPPVTPEKGGKATRSNTNRMEVENADE